MFSFGVNYHKNFTFFKGWILIQRTKKGRYHFVHQDDMEYFWCQTQCVLCFCCKYIETLRLSCTMCGQFNVILGVMVLLIMNRL
jgi:hypothetical protein